MEQQKRKRKTSEQMWDEIPQESQIEIEADYKKWHTENCERLAVQAVLDDVKLDNQQQTQEYLMIEYLRAKVAQAKEIQKKLGWSVKADK